MIKKVLGGLLIICLSFFCFSSAEEIINNSVYVEDVPSSFVIGNYTYSVDKDINFTTNSTGNFIEWKNTPSYNQFFHFFGWIDNKLYYVSYDIQQVQGYLQGRQGFINSFCSASSLSSRCNNFNISAEDFYSINKDITKIAIGNFYGNDYQDAFGLCFYNSLDELYYCAYGAYSTRSDLQYSSLSGSIGFNSSDSIRNYLRGTSPLVKEYVPIQDTIDITDGDIIDYYENNPVYSFNKDMCYIGTRDLSSNYEDRITYYQGSGYTIYEFFEQLYGNNFKLSDLDTWLNSWLVNFNTFFNGNNRYSDGTPWYVLRYNGIGNLLIDKNNLDNPFLNNKSAYYFMASTIYDSYKGYDINPNSEDIAVYCYKKTLVSSDIEFNAPDGIRNNIGNWVNQKNKGKGVGFSGWSIVDGESWNGTPLDYFTGNDIVYTGFNSFFKSSFNRFAGVFQGLDPSDLALGQIPSYIVGFLLLLILFRFLSH